MNVTVTYKNDYGPNYTAASIKTPCTKVDEALEYAYTKTQNVFNFCLCCHYMVLSSNVFASPTVLLLFQELRICRLASPVPPVRQARPNQNIS